jgi:GMC oxidoreductase
LAIRIQDLLRAKKGMLASSSAAPGSHPRSKSVVYPSKASKVPKLLSDFKTIHEVGGMLGYWTGNCPTPHPAELAPFIVQGKWASLLERARQLLKVSYTLGAGSVRQEKLLLLTRSVVGKLDDGREVQQMPVAARREGTDLAKFASIDELLMTSDPHPESPVSSDLICTRIVVDGNRAIGVEARRLQSRQDIVRLFADTIVVAAGVAGTPKILAASEMEIGPALGHYVFDHPTIASRIVLKSEVLEGVPADDPVFTIWVPYSPNHPWQNQICRFPSNPTAIEYASDSRATADIFTFASMNVVESNRFEFDRSRPDPFGLPEIQLRYSLSNQDYSNLGRGLAEHLQIAAAVGDLLEHRWSPYFYGPGWSTHLMGSCRMGATDDGTSCVNATGRLWRYENIYVAGNAVLSTSNAGNPTLTTVAFGLHTADAILGR